MAEFFPQDLVVRYATLWLISLYLQDASIENFVQAVVTPFSSHEVAPYEGDFALLRNAAPFVANIKTAIIRLFLQ